MSDLETKVSDAISRLSSNVREFNSSDQAKKLLDKFLNRQLPFMDKINISFLAAGLMYITEKETRSAEEQKGNKEFFDYIPLMIKSRPSSDQIFFENLVKSLEDETTSAFKKKIKKSYDYRVNIMLSLVRYIRMLKYTLYM